MTFIIRILTYLCGGHVYLTKQCQLVFQCLEQSEYRGSIIRVHLLLKLNEGRKTLRSGVTYLCLR